MFYLRVVQCHSLTIQNTVVGEMKTRIAEMKREAAYQLRVCEQTYNEKIKDLTDNFTQELEKKQEKIDVSCHFIHHSSFITNYIKK